MINRFTGHADLRTLNTCIENQLNSLDSRHTVPKKLNALIKKIQKNEACFSNDENTTDDYVKFLTCYFQIRKLSVSCGEDEQKVPAALEKVVGLARSHFTQLSAVEVDKRQPRHSINPYPQIKDSCDKISLLNQLDQTFYYETLSTWITEQKVSLDRLDLESHELMTLAPYLTYLKISSSESWRENFDDAYIEKILKRAKRLRHLTIRDCAFTGEALQKIKHPERLETLVFKRCLNFDQPLPPGMNALGKIDVKHCPKWSRNHQISFLANIYVDEKKRALDFAGSMEISHFAILSHLALNPNPEKELPALVGSLSYRTTRNMIWCMIGKDGLRCLLRCPAPLVIALLGTKAGRDFVEQNLTQFLADPGLLQFLIDAYPPINPENLPLYPIKAHLEESTLHLTMIPSMARNWPDKVLDIVVNSNCKKIKITHYGGAIEGGREEERQFFKDLMQGLIHSSQEMKFEQFRDGKYILSAKETDSVLQAKRLGMFFGLALRSGCPIGNVLSLEFFLSFRIEHTSIMRILDHTYGTQAAFDAAKTLNLQWQDNALAKAIDARDLNLIKILVLRTIMRDTQGYFKMTEALFSSMGLLMPFDITTIQGRVVTIDRQKMQWDDVTTEDFLMQLQGRVETAETILRTPSCREFVEQNIEFFLRDEFQSHLLAAYPLDKPENASLYPIKIVLRHDKLYLTMIPGMPRFCPDEIVDLFALYNFKKISIAHYGSYVVDRGGPKKQFFAELMQGLIHSSTRYRFEKTESGRLFPVANEDSLKNRKMHFALGRILGLALVAGSPIGEVFCNEFIHCIRSFSKEYLDFLDGDVNQMSERDENNYKQGCITQDEFYRNKTNVDLMEYMKFSTPPSPVSNLVGRVLLSDNEEEAIAAAKELNNHWFDDELTAAISERDVNRVAGIVRNNWLAGYNGYMRVAQAMALGIELCLPFTVRIKNRKKQRCENWSDLGFVTTKQLALQLQGKLTVKWIKDHLVFQPDKSPKALKVKEWINRWLDEHKDEKEVLANVVQTLTGARALTSKITIKLTHTVKGFYVHTCFQEVDVPSDIDEEGIRAVLDSYGRGEHHQFNRS